MIQKLSALLIGSAISMYAATIIDNPTSDTISVNVSNKSVNRIVLPSKILDIVQSKEKGVDIKITDNQAFIKFIPVQKEEMEQIANDKMESVGEPEIVYDKAKPSEVFFITEGKTYAFDLHPKSTESQTIIINDFAKTAEDVIKYETESDYISNLAKINQQILSGGTPSGYKYKEVDEDIKTNGAKVSLKKIGIYEGILYKAELFEIASHSNRPERISPKSFIKIAESAPKAITVYYDNEVNNLLPFGKAKAVIITKVKHNGQ